MEPNKTSPLCGRMIRVQDYWAYVPHPLPQTMTLNPEVVAKLSVADQSIGKLEGLCYRLPNPHLLSGAYATREAVLSSRIEGTRATEADLYLFEVDPESARNPADIREVKNYVLALNYAIERRNDLPLSLRLLREAHEKLTRGVRGDRATPGEFRRSQNWIGGPNPQVAEYVPPPVPEMNEALDSLEKFLHRPAKSGIPVLIESAMAHYQFESIHPFLDGNGRTGRLLCTLLLIERECLSHPVLYLSAYLNAHRDEYFSHLTYIRTSGDWQSWFAFFLEGVAEQAEDAIWRAGRILALYADYKRRDVTPTSAQLVELLMTSPYVTIKSVSERCKVSDVTASTAIKELIAQNILQPLYTDRIRKQVYFAPDIIETYSSARAGRKRADRSSPNDSTQESFVP